MKFKRISIVFLLALMLCAVLALASVAFAEDQEAKGLGTQEAITYQTATFVDPSHPEKGLNWTTESCTNYTLLSTLSEEQFVNLSAGWYVLDKTIERKRLCTVESGVNIILMDGYTLTIYRPRDEGKVYPGVKVTGTISFYGQTAGTGTLTTSGRNTNGIAGDGNGATLNFYGGQIYANGSGSNSGIGSYGDVTNIYGGYVEASSGHDPQETEPGILSEGPDDTSYVNIYGGTVKATGHNGGAGIGSGYNSKHDRAGKGITIYGGDVTATGGACGAGIGGGNGQEGRNITIMGGNVTAIGGGGGAGIGGGQMGDASNISIYGGTVNATSNYGDGSGIGSGRGGDIANIKIYDGDITATSYDHNPAIGGRGDGLYIYGGNITATSNGYAPAIGGSSEDTITNIHIEGGNIIANAGKKGAGIGTGHKGTVNYLYIAGGTIIANGGEEGAGIGGAYQSTVQYIEISGGTVTATGGSDAAGIGGGKNSSASDITITNGTVTATGGSRGTGIGGGYAGTGTRIKITGGTVFATGGIEAAGIGGSYQHNGEIITISDGNVTAQGGENAAGIGGGKQGAGINITISGGVVTAKGGAEQGACIGGGINGSSDNITISGGYVKAMRANNGSAAIGGGYGSPCGNVTIKNCVVEAQGGYWGPAIGSGASCGLGTSNICIEKAVVKCYAPDGGGYPAIGLGPWSDPSKASCTVTVSENSQIWNMGTGEQITNPGGNIAGKLGNSSLLITTGTIVPQGITVKAVEYASTISDADKARLEEIMGKFALKASGELTLLQSQVGLAQSILGYTNDQMLSILADQTKHIDLSLVFEVQVVAADFSNAQSPVIEYALKPVATARLYNTAETLDLKSKVLTPDDFEIAKGKLEVTMPVPIKCVPTLIRHSSDDGSVIYNDFTLDDTMNCTLNTKNQTVTIVIDHCSHLTTFFGPESMPSTGDRTPIAPLTAMAIVAGMCVALAAIRTLAAVRKRLT